jgi:hypothetical protein
VNIDKHIAAIPSQSAEQRAGVRANADRWLATGTDDQKATAAQLIAALDAQATAEAGALYESLKDLPVAQRVIEAFKREPLTETERKVIQVLVDHPWSLSSELSAALGWEGAWSMHFGALCRRRQAYLWPAPEKFDDTGKDFYTSILADFKDMRIALKPDVTAAMAALGVQSKA